MAAVLTIAHRAGNSRDALRRALDAGVGAVEADLRLDGDRLVARHARRLPFLPVFVDRWYVRWSTTPQITLDELLAETHSRASLLADLKSTSRRSADLLLETLHRRGAVERSMVSSTYWELLERIRKAEPGLRVYFSVGDEQHLDAFFKIAEHGLASSGASIDEALLDEGRARRLRERGLDVIAYHVGDIGRASQLVEWGVSGITSDDLALLRALLGRPAPECRGPS